jgi:hypothetical protein
MVLLRRPPDAVLKAQGLDDETVRGVSRRLVPEAEISPYVVIRRFGNAYVLGDPNTKEEVKAFKQPVAAERLVPLTANELEEGYETKVSVEVAGETGVVQGMGMDGRVRVTFGNEQMEDQVWLRTKPAAVKDMTKGGLWLDLTKIEHTFAEEIKEQMAVMREIPMGNHRTFGDGKA